MTSQRKNMTSQRKYKWEIVTKIEKKERGIIVMLDSLEENPGHQNKSSSKLKTRQINTEDGLKPLLEKLDLVFKSRQNNDAYDAYLKLTSLKKNEDMTMLDYLLEFKHLYHKMTKHDMSLPETVLVFKLLEGANLTLDERKLALALGNDLKFKTMKFVLKRVFGKIPAGAGRGGGKRTRAGGVGSLVQHQAPVNSNTLETGVYNKVIDVSKHESISCIVCSSTTHSCDECPYAAPCQQDDVEANTKNVPEKSTDPQYDPKDPQNTIVNVGIAVDAENMKLLVEEAESAILNTFCHSTIVGEQWFYNYTEKLSPLHQKGIEIYPSSTVYKFANGATVKSTKTAVFPVKIASTICKLEAEIVEEDIPLILGKTALRKSGTIIDIQQEKARMFGHDLDLNVSCCGHFYINIFPEENEYLYLNEEGGLIMDDDESPSMQKEKMTELHIQFGHATAENLKRIARNAGIMTDSLHAIIDDVIEECSTCSIVGLSESNDFNQRVFVGFHELQLNVWYMHIIDEYTRFSNAAIIRNRNATVRTFLKCWVSLFDAPREIFTDNNSRFIGDDFFEMCESFGVSMSETPPTSPWSNGVCERHNQTLTSILLEIQEDNKCDWETALVWAISAKNAIINHNGLSPAQLVFGSVENCPTLSPSSANDLSHDTSYSDPLNESSLPDPLPIKMKMLSSTSERKVQSSQPNTASDTNVTKRNKEARMRKSFNHYQHDRHLKPHQKEMTHWNDSSRVLVPVLLLRKGDEYVKAQVCRVEKKSCDADGEGSREDGDVTADSSDVIVDSSSVSRDIDDSGIFNENGSLESREDIVQDDE